MEDLVSIIIPIYKAEAYLRICVDSVLSQSYKNIEVILVDDGSPDSCPSICDDYLKKDKRVKVIHKPNGGASSARNCGLEYANGKYLCFVDSDDFVPCNSVKILVESIKNNNSDYAAGICIIRETGAPKSRIETERIIDFELEPKELLKYITTRGSYSPYAKIFVTDIIKRNTIKYDETLKCSEDALFIRTYLGYCSRISLVPQNVYEYTALNESSLSKKGYFYYCEYYVKKMKALETICQRLPLTEKERTNFLFERAVHGLKISTNHYMTHWPRNNERKVLVLKSVTLLMPWLNNSADPILEPLTINKKLIKWWEKSKNTIYTCNYDKFYSIQEKMYRYDLIKRNIRKLAKR